MKNFLNISLLVFAFVILSGCEIVVTNQPGRPPNFELLDANYQTNYEADVDGDGELRYVICDDRTTFLTYTLRFEGELDTWTSYLRGVRTGEVVGRETFDSRDTRVNRYDEGEAEVEYEIRARGAPLLVAPQAIVPRPKVEGYTQLFLEVNGYEEGYELSSNDIPVLATCGN